MEPELSDLANEPQVSKTDFKAEGVKALSALAILGAYALGCYIWDRYKSKRVQGQNSEAAPGEAVKKEKPALFIDAHVESNNHQVAIGAKHSVFGNGGVAAAYSDGVICVNVPLNVMNQYPVTLYKSDIPIQDVVSKAKNIYHRIFDKKKKE